MSISFSKMPSTLPASMWGIHVFFLIDDYDTLKHECIWVFTSALLCVGNVVISHLFDELNEPAMLVMLTMRLLISLVTEVSNFPFTSIQSNCYKLKPTIQFAMKSPRPMLKHGLLAYAFITLAISSIGLMFPDSEKDNVVWCWCAGQILSQCADFITRISSWSPTRLHVHANLQFRMIKLCIQGTTIGVRLMVVLYTCLGIAYCRDIMVSYSSLKSRSAYHMYSQLVILR